MSLYRVIKDSSIITSVWSGGKTRQIHIFPLEAVYENRDFEYRISSATVDSHYSTFTPLEGFNRYIMSLTENIRLVHNKNISVKLKPFKLHSFKGSDYTECFGECTDFNLMVKEPYTGSLKCLHFNNEYDFENIVGIYCLENNSKFILSHSDKNENITIDKGDFILLNPYENYKCQIIGGENSIAAIGVLIY